MRWGSWWRVTPPRFAGSTSKRCLAKDTQEIGVAFGTPLASTPTIRSLPVSSCRATPHAGSSTLKTTHGGSPPSSRRIGSSGAVGQQRRRQRGWPGVCPGKKREPLPLRGQRQRDACRTGGAVVLRRSATAYASSPRPGHHYPSRLALLGRRGGNC